MDVLTHPSFLDVPYHGTLLGLSRRRRAWEVKGRIMQQFLYRNLLATDYKLCSKQHFSFFPIIPSVLAVLSDTSDRSERESRQNRESPKRKLLFQGVLWSLQSVTDQKLLSVSEAQSRYSSHDFQLKYFYQILTAYLPASGYRATVRSFDLQRSAKTLARQNWKCCSCDYFSPIPIFACAERRTTSQ